MKGLIRAIPLTLFIAAFPAFSEDEMRDFYAEPGMNPFRTASGQDVTENIDPFSGNVQLSYVDLSIPGNGGLDINITRYYNLPQSSPGYANPYGYGWTMHLGRITIGSGHASQLCGGDAVPGGDTRDNPSIEMPSGGRELLVRSSVLNDGTYITKSNWRARCIDDTDYTRGIVATAPDGNAYYLREYVFMQGEDGPAGEAAPTVETWLTNQIVDVHGNSIDVSYLAIASGAKLMNRIETSDGREVDFEYLDGSDMPVTATSVNARLSAIKANGETWQYQYAPFSGGTASGWSLVDHYRLQRVVRPDGSSWDYEYGSTVSDPAYRRLTRVTYPAGGEINYSYQWLRPYLPNPDFSIVAIDTKTQTNPGYTSGSWRYQFEPGSVDFADLGVQPLPANAGRLADFTRITTPHGVEHLYHVGYWALVGTHDILWEMGLKIRHQYLAVDPGGSTLSPVRSISNSWGFRQLSDEVYRGGILSDLWDAGTYAPLLTRQSVTLDGYTYTTDYGDHDAFGNPGKTTQYAIYPTEGGNRITDATYHNNTVAWFIGLPETETVTQDGAVIGSISRSYNEFGQLQSLDHFGVTTQYEYSGQGDLAAVIDARGHVTHYSNYYRGTAQLEELPDGTRRSGAVNASGSLVSRTSGRGYTTSFSYDGLHRLTGIDYPKGSDVSIDWRATGKTLVRGAYRERVDWDGFGREVFLRREDLVNGNTYDSRFDYDESGRKVFASNVNSSSGIGWVYDAIGRTTAVRNQDGSYKTVTHRGAHRELHGDENNNVVEYLYQVYGSPDNRYLSWVLSPEGVGTRISRNAYGNITAVFQGGEDAGNPGQYLGYTQVFAYNDRWQLTSVDSPADIGLSVYGRDMLGNITSKQIGGSNITGYSYDPMNRIAALDYPNDSLDIIYSYDADGSPETVANSNGVRAYHYDENGHLISEGITIRDQQYQLSYFRDELDHLSGMTYPSGRTLDYAPDALGRPTQALPFVVDVSYHSDGSLEQLSYANGRVTNITRTVTNRVDTMTVAGLFNLDYGYDLAGNVTEIQDSINPSTHRSITYDGLHRLSSVSADWGTSVYEYDVYSNITRKSDPAQGNRDQYYQYLGLMLNQVSYQDAYAQRGFAYDDYGNISYSDDVLYDPITGFPQQVYSSRQHLFDDAGNLVFSHRVGKNNVGSIIAARTGSFSSEYDGKNNRIRKINHSDDNHISDFVYSEAGLLLGEYDETGTYYGNEYFYLGTQQVATAKVNSPPQLDLGDDLQTYGGSRVDLSATAYDPDGEVISGEWIQLSGPLVSIDNPQASHTYFIAPAEAGGANIVLQYTVSDDRGAESTQMLTISVASNHPPIADAGADVNVLAGNALQLDGSRSSDPEGTISYAWSGSYLEEANVSRPVIAPPDLGFNYILTYTLTVTDSYGAIDTDSMTIGVFTMRVDNDQDGLPDGWEVIHFGDASAFDALDDPDGDGVGNARELSGDTNPNVAEFPLPVTRLGVIQGNEENTVVWERPGGAALFKVLWTTDPGASFDTWHVVAVTERFFEHVGLDTNVAYHYAVVAQNTMGDAAKSAVVSGVPGMRSWQPSQRLPDSITSFDSSSTRIAANQLGDTVILSETVEGSVYRLYVWQTAVFDEWGEPELVSEDSYSHDFAKVDIDEGGNVLVSWAGGAAGSRDLYAAYRPYAKSFREREAVEDYAGEGTPSEGPIDGYADGDVVELSHLEFTGGGVAYACWRQNRLHTVNTVADTSGASAIVKRFDPIMGWTGEHNLEVLNNVGDSLNLACDVARNGQLVVAWERYNTFNPQPGALEGLGHDVWVSVYSPLDGWAISETVEFLDNGIREDSGLGIQNHLPKVAVDNKANAAVAWYNGSDNNIELIEFDFAAGQWLPQEILESRRKQIPNGTGHQVASDDNGHFIVAWGSKYTTKTSGATDWTRPRSLPAPPLRLGIDELGQPYSIHLSGTDLVANRSVDGSWSSAELNEVSDGDVKTVVTAVNPSTGSLAVYWLSGSSLMRSSYEPDVAPGTGSPLPVTSFSTQVKKVKGVKTHTVTLAVNKVATSYFRFSGQGTINSGGDSIANWQVYTDPVVIQLDKNGSGEFEFYSQDMDGNVEAIKLEVLQ